LENLDMNNRSNEPIKPGEDGLVQLAELLAKAHLRFRQRLARREIATFSEKRLDDVDDSARFGTGEARTSEKGARP